MTDQSAEMPESFDTPEAAMRWMSSQPEKEQPAESADPATAEPELAQANAGPETAPGEDPTGDDAEADKLPPIERPRAWSKGGDDDWNALPRARQESIAANEREREADHNRRINEVAEQRKIAEAKAAEADKARQTYEAKLPEVMQNLVEVNNRDYADIKSQADIDTLIRAMNQLATTDPVQAQQINAYLTGWQLHQAKMAATKAELDQTNQRKTQQEQADWIAFMNEHDAKVIAKVPELADKEKAAALVKTAGDMFLDVGFTQDDLNGFKRGVKISPYHSGMQQIIVDAIKFRQLEAAKAALPDKVARNLPPVQRPGTSRQGAGASERLQALDTRLNNSGDVKDAVALLLARRAAPRRAS